MQEFEEHTSLPKSWEKGIDGNEHDVATQLSMHRTYMSSARSHMSNERTHLSYLRTSLSLMSFGITLNRFSIFLRKSEIHVKGHGMLQQTESVGLGIMLVGIAILGWALYRYRVVNHEIENDTYHSPQLAMSILTGLILGLAGVVTGWMMTSRS